MKRFIGLAICFASAGVWAQPVSAQTVQTQQQVVVTCPPTASIDFKNLAAGWGGVGGGQINFVHHSIDGYNNILQCEYSATGQIDDHFVMQTPAPATAMINGATTCKVDNATPTSRDFICPVPSAQSRAIRDTAARKVP